MPDNCRSPSPEERGAEADTVLAALCASLVRQKGVRAAFPLLDRDRNTLRELEDEAGKNAFMGLGRFVNTGVTAALQRRYLFAALTDPQFDWGCKAALSLTVKGVTAGEEVRDPEEIRRLRGRDDVWFMYESFVVYKNRIDYPRDLMSPDCRFETPALPADWWEWPPEAAAPDRRIVANPSALSDTYLKKCYFGGADTPGLGTILVGGDPV